MDQIKQKNGEKKNEHQVYVDSYLTFKRSFVNFLTLTIPDLYEIFSIVLSFKEGVVYLDKDRAEIHLLIQIACAYDSVQIYNKIKQVGSYYWV